MIGRTDNLGEKKGKKEQKQTFEIMRVSEIMVQEEKGAQLLSLLFKAENPEWGETEGLLVKETLEYNNRQDKEGVNFEMFLLEKFKGGLL
ncbi:MAG: hypothetical protein US18_C0013G0007 [Parcubacteria group bacterium GW2011_GWB1_36_5]|nr:MAG: hypothetical protein US12_C0026G0008 [Parcubacteria group bacterium GW2011_GWA2_36_24]KKQ07559.1 MAG: hypothetical protein US18_C0013G0007 [Parcubacteria group bacterium GW2011_GWB1_36_5]